MSDVFISYSRRDKVFTQKLYEALRDSGREIWADWDSIPAASDWFAEIKDGVEKANTIVFVLSPEWLKSNECRKEYDHAVAMGKRLLPILYQVVDPKEVPSELAKINWVYMRDTDDFGQAFQTLSAAMDTDLEWVKTHTRIQIRAIEWDKKSRDHSFLLRGNDLTDGEQFIAQGAQKSPEPTVLHGEYVLASRKDATRRQRMTLAGVTVALVVSVALGIVAFFQRQAAVAARADAVVERDRAVAAEKIAEDERDRADVNAEVAYSRELAAASLNSLNHDPELSLLLGLQSVAITDKTGMPIQPMSEDALRRSVQTSRIRKTWLANSGSVLDIAISPDGTKIASASDDLTVKIWDLSGKLLLTIPDFSEEVDSVVFSPDGSQILTSSGQEAVAWDAVTGEKLVEYKGHVSYVVQAVYSPDGKFIATASSDATAIMWDALSGESLVVLGGHETELSDIAYSPDGEMIASTDYNGAMYVWSTSSKSLLYMLSEGEGSVILDVEFSPDGKYILISDNYFQTIVLVAQTGKVISAQNVHTDFVTNAVVSPDGAFMASASTDNTVVVSSITASAVLFGQSISADPDYIDISKVMFRFTDSTDINTMIYTPDGKYLITGNDEGQIKIWDANPISDYEVSGFRPHTARIDGMEFSPDGEHYVTVARDGKAFIWSLTDQSSIELVGHQNVIQDVAFSSDGMQIITGGYDGHAIIWDAKTGDKLLTLSKDDQLVTGVNFSPDGKLAVGSLGDNTVVVWDAVSGDEVRVLQSKDMYAYINELAFSPDGKTLAVSSDAGFVVLWDVATWNQIDVLAGHTDWVKGLDYSSGGTHMVTASYDTTAIIWDVATRTPVLKLEGHSQGVNDVTYSPDDTLVATASVDGTAKLWNANTGELLVTYQTSADQILSVAFSADGKYLATGSETGVVRIYYVYAEDALELAKSRITRTFTEEECLKDLHEEACPANLPQPQQ